MVQLASAARASYPGVVAAIAVAIAEAAAAGTWRRLKSCAGSACGQGFYDNSAAADAQGCDMHAGGAPEIAADAEGSRPGWCSDHR
jgi:predicted RNA-binding Zn ribbon-like protein